MKGSIIKRGCTCGEKCTCNKKWTLVIDVGKNLITGKRKQMWIGKFTTREEAEAEAAIIIAKIKKGQYNIETDMLFEAWANEWLTEYIKRYAPKPGTIRIRQYGINKLLSYFNNLKLKKITEDMYQAVLDDFKNQNLAMSTIESINTTGRLLFKKAVEKKLLNDNPTINAYIIKNNDNIINEDEENKMELPKFLEVEELVHFLDIAKENGLYMDELIFTTLSFTGMRVGELVVLKWGDIDFDKHTISINKTYYNPTNNTTKYLLVRPKTTKSKRVINVDPDLIEMFRKYKEEQDKIISRLGDSYHNRGYIFTNLNRHLGYPILIKFVANRMARLLKLSGLNLELTPHTLRHTHTSLLAQAEVELDEIMDRLGHEDDEVTRKVYLHITNYRRKNASNKFSNLVRGYRKKKT
ncbi:site-specific integrase [Priestia megaterium]|nr:site-specific integrase [Priestia megaterium]